MNSQTNPTFRTHPDAARLAGRLALLAPGDILTYEEAKVMFPHLSLTGKHRNIAEAAKKKVRRDTLIVIECVRTVGWKHCTPEEVADIPEAGRKHCRRRMRHDLLKLATVDTIKHPELRNKVESEATVLGTMILFSDNKAMRKIETAVLANGKRIEAEETLKLFAPKA